MKIAKFGLIGIFTLSLLFHLLVISGVVDYHMVWGGQLKSRSDMIRFESISLIVNVFFLMVILMRLKLLRTLIPPKIIQILLYVMAIIFALNTLGNLMSENKYEKLIFTPITSITFLLLIYLLRHKPKQSN